MKWYEKLIGSPSVSSIKTQNFSMCRRIELRQPKLGIPYDVPNVELTHVGELCSFDAFLGKMS